jgi:16S rRNA processing protein RimM
LVRIGTIVGSRGNKGEVKFRPEGPLDAGSLRTLFVRIADRDEEFQVEALGPQGAVTRLKLKGIDSMDGAERLAGCPVFLPEEALPPPEPNAYYHYQLVGCRVVTVDGREVGIVKDVWTIPANDQLVVDRNGRDVLVPFSRTFCREIDIAGKRVVIDVPDGLLDLNEI